MAQQCHIDFVGAALRLCNLNTQHICEKDVSCVSEVVFHSKLFLICPTFCLFLFFFAACDFSKCPWKQLTKGRQLPHQISICNNYLEEAELEIRLDFTFSCVNSSTSHMLMTTPEGMFFALGQLLSCVYLCCN